MSISDTSADADLSNQLYNSSTILQKYMDDDLKIDECHIYTWQVPSAKSQDEQTVKYYVEVSLKASEDEWLTWMIFFGPGCLQMWMGLSDDETYGDKLD